MGFSNAIDDDYIISFDKKLLQTNVIHEFLNKTYWSPGIELETVLTAINNSLTVGAYTRSTNQIGFARLITDYATFGYLADVFVLESYRGQGLARAMVNAILDKKEMKKLRRILLATKDAHRVYTECGFEQIADARPFMQIYRPDIYAKS